MRQPAPIREFRIALALLTRLPVGRIAEPVPTLAQARWAFALCGVIVGALAWAAYLIASLAGLSPGLCAWAALGMGVLVTGAMHEDGLADLADGFGGGHDRARKLEIMRDSRIGSYGVIAVILSLAVRAESIGELSGGPQLLVAFIAIATLSRGLMLVGLEFLPAARADGLGHMAAAPGGWRFAVGIGCALLAFLPLLWLAGVAAIWIACAMGVAAFLVAQLAIKQIGGQTGDALGAIQLTSETLGWVAAAAVLSGW